MAASRMRTTTVATPTLPASMRKVGESSSSSDTARGEGSFYTEREKGEWKWVGRQVNIYAMLAEEQLGTEYYVW
jgi:hypothetical protein